MTPLVAEVMPLMPPELAGRPLKPRPNDRQRRGAAGGRERLRRTDIARPIQQQNGCRSAGGAAGLNDHIVARLVRAQGAGRADAQGAGAHIGAPGVGIRTVQIPRACAQFGHSAGGRRDDPGHRADASALEQRVLPGAADFRAGISSDSTSRDCQKPPARPQDPPTVEIAVPALPPRVTRLPLMFTTV